MEVGIIGAILILAAWILETRKLAQSKHIKDIDEKFLVIYIMGSILLTIYSVQKGDAVFTLLGVAITFLTLIELVFVYIKKH